MTNADDEALVGRALAGDDAARRSLAERLLDSVQREVSFCLVRASAPLGRDPRQDLRDLVQDVLIAVFEADGRELRRWDPRRGRNLDSFIRLVARRRVARILTQRRGRSRVDVPTAPEDIDATDDLRLVRHLEGSQQLDRLLVLLDANMSARDHELFDLLFVQELEPEEVAGRLDMTRGAVNAWSYRLRKLARELASRLDEISSSDEASARRERRGHGG